MKRKWSNLPTHPPTMTPTAVAGEVMTRTAVDKVSIVTFMKSYETTTTSAPTSTTITKSEKRLTSATAPSTTAATALLDTSATGRPPTTRR
uniref:Uncharacterized protein n=1 Tax=Setaria italica TaxID=4555 RepID=K3ZG86_SETIT